MRESVCVCMGERERERELAKISLCKKCETGLIGSENGSINVQDYRHENVLIMDSEPQRLGYFCSFEIEKAARVKSRIFLLVKIFFWEI